MIQRRLRSFVRRGGFGTKGQARAQEEYGPTKYLHVDNGLVDIARDFGRDAPCYLEIGFGSGHSLYQVAKNHPEVNFIGIETYRPGIGTLLMAMEEGDVDNIRLFDADAIDVLDKCIAQDSLAGAQLFFPDPWQKRRHHARRIIQIPFVLKLVEKIKVGGSLHIATDWEDYAIHIMQVLSAIEALENIAGAGQYAERSPRRPVLTKFERRAIREGRVIREFQFIKLR